MTHHDQTEDCCDDGDGEHQRMRNAAAAVHGEKKQTCDAENDDDTFLQ